jgi:ribosomal protein L7Ae-like RNA K-turn-binding protein
MAGRTLGPEDRRALGVSGLLGLIGLGYRGRGIVVGVDSIRRELQGQRCWCVILAADASDRAREKVGRLAAAQGIPVIAGPSAEAIGARIGKPPVMAVGVRDRALADGMLRLGNETGS